MNAFPWGNSEKGFSGLGMKIEALRVAAYGTFIKATLTS